MEHPLVCLSISPMRLLAPEQCSHQGLCPRRTGGS
uniref:Uncharacterized protein n=1 Tax=Arundo donax TaxID=35708 RepID=A0A0A9FNV3_ARUDO